MKTSVQQAIETAVSAIEQAAREHREYDGDPHERQVDQRAFHAAIDERRDRAVAAAKTTIAKELAVDAGTYQRLRRTAFNEAAIAAAWQRVEKLLDSGRGVDDVVERESFTREEAEALRRNYGSWLAVKMPDSRPVDVERRALPALEAVQRAELGLMPADERQATEADLDRRSTQAVVVELDRLAADARATGRVRPSELLRVAYTMSAAGAEPSRQSWSDIVSQVDPESRARRARNSLDPAIRSKLDGNAGDVGWAEPSLQPPVASGTGSKLDAREG